jgi:hypothetical protein
MLRWIKRAVTYRSHSVWLARSGTLLTTLMQAKSYLLIHRTCRRCRTVSVPGPSYTANSPILLAISFPLQFQSDPPFCTQFSIIHQDTYVLSRSGSSDLASFPWSLSTSHHLYNSTIHFSTTDHHNAVSPRSMLLFFLLLPPAPSPFASIPFHFSHAHPIHFSHSPSKDTTSQLGATAAKPSANPPKRPSYTLLPFLHDTDVSFNDSSQAGRASGQGRVEDTKAYLEKWTKKWDKTKGE